MVSSYSVIIIGLGIFSFWALFSISTQIEMGLDDENLVSDSDEFFTTSMLLNLADWGMNVGGAIAFCGVFIMARQFSTSKNYSPEKKKVSVFWQIVCCFIPGFDLWAVYRIKKLRFGVIWWAISYVSGFAELYGLVPEIGNPILVSLLSALIYVGFVFKWSRDWNKMFSGVQISEDDRPIFSG